MKLSKWQYMLKTTKIMFIKYGVNYIIHLKAIEKYNSAICYDFNLDKNELCLQLNLHICELAFFPNNSFFIKHN